MKLPEEGTGSNPCCSAAPAGDSQASRVWSGPPAVLQQRGLTVRRKTKKQKEIASNDRWVNPQRWEETSAKRGKHLNPENLAFYKGPKLLTSKGTKLDRE